MDRITFTGPTIGSPEWAGDYLSRDHLVPTPAKVDAAQFNAIDAVKVTLTAQATAADVSLAVAALTGAIPSGTVLDFGGNKFAKTSAAVAAGAVAIPVGAVPVTIANASVATYAGTGMKTIPSGTVIGRTLAERNAGTNYGPAAAADDEVFITAFDVLDVTKLDDVELYRPGSLVKENFLPGWATLAGAVQTLVRAKYICIRGAE